MRRAWHVGVGAVLLGACATGPVPARSAEPGAPPAEAAAPAAPETPTAPPPATAPADDAPTFSVAAPPAGAPVAPLTVRTITRMPVPVARPAAPKSPGPREGTVRLALVIGTDGAVSSWRIKNGMGEPYDGVAGAYAAQLRFEPALGADGKPIELTITWTVAFAAE